MLYLAVSYLPSAVIHHPDPGITLYPEGEGVGTGFGVGDGLGDGLGVGLGAGDGPARHASKLHSWSLNEELDLPSLHAPIAV
jgi:hypothetical protein